MMDNRRIPMAKSFDAEKKCLFQLMLIFFTLLVNINLIQYVLPTAIRKKRNFIAAKLVRHSKGTNYVQSE